MSANSLYPSYLVLDYHSPFGRHHQTIPTRQWNPLGGTSGAGGYEAWDNSDRDAVDMMADLVTRMLAFYRATVIYDTWTIWNVPSVGASPIPVKQGAIVSGTGLTTSGWYEAVQTTFTFFDTGFNTVKLVLLDSNSNDQFIHVAPGETNSIMDALIDEFTSQANAWQSRAGFRPNVVRSVTFDLNDKLRDSYHLS